MTETSAAERPHVVVVGGGFGGLAAARALRGRGVRVTLVDRRNHHLFQPLLYQVATAALSPADVAAPIRSILRRHGEAEVRMAEARGVDPVRRSVLLADGSALAYDFLIVATGATHAYFGHPEWEPLAPGLKTIEDATEIRRRFLLAFEAAEAEEDPGERRALLTFVVVGGGATGVEMAGSMAEMARRSLVRDFRRIDPGTARVILLEGGERILSSYDPRLSAYARRALERIGVEVRTGSIVTGVEPEAVRVGGERIRTRNVVWAAGVTASPLGAALGVPLDRAGRVLVEPDLSAPGHPEVFVVGDLAAMEQDGAALPGVAPVALQQGRAAARNVLRTLAGRPRRAFRYRDRGSMATIGRRAAVMQSAGLRLRGWPAWMAWLLIHIVQLIGFRNRLLVMIQWAWIYFTWQRGARLITGRVGAELAPRGLPLGTPDGEPIPPARGSPASRDAAAAAERQPAPPGGGAPAGGRRARGGA
jgi:NADH:ubiquinone reductase (H+-translocating)